MLPEVDRIISAIEKAQNDWTDWDWANAFQDHDGETYFLEGSGSATEEMPQEVQEEAELYSRRVQEDAKSASKYGDAAIKALKKDDLNTAMEELESASSTEQNWGSDPVWGVPRKQLEKLLTDLELRFDDALDTINLDVDDPIDYEFTDTNLITLKWDGKKKAVNLLKSVMILESKSLKDPEEFWSLIK